MIIVIKRTVVSQTLILAILTNDPFNNSNNPFYSSYWIPLEPIVKVKYNFDSESLSSDSTEYNYYQTAMQKSDGASFETVTRNQTISSRDALEIVPLFSRHNMLIENFFKGCLGYF